MPTPHTLLIADVHLCPAQPGVSTQLLNFLDGVARQAEALYILGDLFEYWAGDDDMASPPHQAVLSALKSLTTSGTQLHVMHGNRDVLLGKDFAERVGATLLPDPVVVDFYGHTTLLTHGDVLCTDDLAYQQLREQVRNPHWQQAFLSQPLSARKTFIEGLRQRSRAETAQKPAAIMDVNPHAVAEIIRSHGYPADLIHGHTHRPSKHTVQVDHHTCTRWVLGAWEDAANCLRVNAAGVHAIPL